GGSHFCVRLMYADGCGRKIAALVMPKVKCGLGWLLNNSTHVAESYFSAQSAQRYFSNFVAQD
ncbi:hypothetical protein, partial [Pseudoglutamicibacter cumminsii]|uniref:hypothetical protein n=1 Tax=Pseudoglutamicibacter cumminsii TaxID=156979 RepID=UPI0021A82A58